MLPRFPAAFRPPASACWASCPAGDCAPLAIGPPRHHQRGPRRGFHVPHASDPAGVGALYTPGPAVFTRPSQGRRPPPAASQQPAPVTPVLPPAPGNSNQQDISKSSPVFARPAFPSPVAPGRNQRPWAFPRSSAPLRAGPTSARPGRGQVPNTDPKPRPRHHRTSTNGLTHNVRPHVATPAPIVQLPATASRAPAASLHDRHAPTLDPAPTRRGFAPTRRTRWSSQTGFFLIWQSMTAQVNGFLPSQEPDLWCDDGNRSLRSSREELVARTRSGVLARVPAGG